MADQKATLIVKVATDTASEFTKSEELFVDIVFKPEPLQFNTTDF